ncbi:hypothetical protein D5086_020763 [Populus alba]|uniref:Uncharacterized protein n=1 Tax=Populus alba TaxID=43335 RepID=A0ACC4BLC0_POPAL
MGCFSCAGKSRKNASNKKPDDQIPSSSVLPCHYFVHAMMVTLPHQCPAPLSLCLYCDQSPATVVTTIRTQVPEPHITTIAQGPQSPSKSPHVHLWLLPPQPLDLESQNLQQNLCCPFH